MSVKVTVRIPEELYDKVKNSQYSTLSECIIQAIVYFFDHMENNTMKIYTEDQQNMINFLQSSLADAKQTCQTIQKQLDLKDEQLKTKDQQIFSLIAVQKDLTEKATEQVKLLSEKIGSKKWYQFWK